MFKLYLPRKQVVCSDFDGAQYPIHVYGLHIQRALLAIINSRRKPPLTATLITLSVIQTGTQSSLEQSTQV